MTVWYGDSCKVDPGVPHNRLRKIASAEIEKIISATGGVAGRGGIDFSHNGADRLAGEGVINHG